VLAWTRDQDSTSVFSRLFLDPSLLQQLDSSCHGRPSVLVVPEPCTRHHNSNRSLAPIKYFARGRSAATESPGSRGRPFGMIVQTPKASLVFLSLMEIVTRLSFMRDPLLFLRLLRMCRVIRRERLS